MQPVAVDEHDLVARGQLLAEDRRAAAGDEADRAAGQLDLGRVDQLGKRRRLASSPRRAGVHARLAPTGEQRSMAILAGDTTPMTPVAKYALTTSGSAPTQQRSLTIAATVS